MSNPLLVRPELAKVKNTTYKLPGAGHTYGKPMERDAEDAGSGVHDSTCLIGALLPVLPRTAFVARSSAEWTDGLVGSL